MKEDLFFFLCMQLKFNIDVFFIIQDIAVWKKTNSAQYFCEICIICSSQSPLFNMDHLGNMNYIRL